MSRKYEGVIVLDTKGREDAVDKLINDIGSEIEAEGAKLEQIDRIGRRKFPYSPKHVEEGFYVNYMFEAEPAALANVEARLKLNDDVYLQHYQKI